jgi:hypothetical protein
MKKTQLAQALLALAQCTPGEASRSLAALTDFVEKLPGSTVATILKQFEAGRKAEKVPHRSPAELRRPLQSLARIVAATGSKAASNEVDRLVAVLLPNGASCSIEDFVHDLKQLSDRPRPKPKASPPKIADEQLAQRLAAELERVKGDAGRFPLLMETLKNAKKVDTPTLQRIGQIFLRRPRLGKGRKPVLDALINRHHDELRYSFQESSLERLRK